MGIILGIKEYYIRKHDYYQRIIKNDDLSRIFLLYCITIYNCFVPRILWIDYNFKRLQRWTAKYTQFINLLYLICNLNSTTYYIHCTTYTEHCTYNVHTVYIVLRMPYI